MTGKILIVDDVATNRIVLKVKLAGARYQTFQARSGAEALRVIAAERPDLVLMDATLPDVDGFELCRAIRAQRATADLPVVMMSAAPGPEAELAALRAGASDLLPKPCDENELLARLRALLRARDADQDLQVDQTAIRELGFAEPATGFAPPSRIGLVTGSRDTALIWKSTLARHLPGDALLVLGHDEALALASSPRCPDAFLIASDLGRIDEGLRLMSELRARTSSRHAAICIAVPEGQPGAAAAAFDLGADDVVSAAMQLPLVAEQAALRLRRQIDRKRQSERQRESLRNGLRLAVTDPLTGLHNRRYAMPHLMRMAEQAQQTHCPIAVMVLDLDRFKTINDTWGHTAGDAVLVEVAARLRNCLRPNDLLARIGGEEFLIAMPDTPLAEARLSAERLCRTIGASPVQVREIGQVIPVTVSIGLAIGGERADTRIDRLFTEADHALLDSKAEGRNQVTVFSRTAA